jgi:mono/diheme cytochrome c family protein/plastocyanin
MTDQPGSPPPDGTRLPARRPPSQPAPVERFTAPRTAHVNELTPERAAKIVEQSASARVVALLASLIVVLFVIGYYFLEVGLPLGLSEARTSTQRDLQQVTAIERGYNLFQANCARCHGPNGKGTNEGYTAPPLNDQMKLYVHLNEKYIANVLREGGRLVCGNPKSAMPIWSNENGGPLNYVQIQNLIAFLRAPSNREYVIRDPNTLEPEENADGTEKTFKGWRDPNFKPDPAATAVPDCWAGEVGGSQAPTQTLPPDVTPLDLVAQTFAFDKHELEVAAGQVFAINLDNEDTGVNHDVDIRDASGKTLQDQKDFFGVATQTYTYQPLEAGTYTFICSIHPIPGMTGTLTVK